MLTFGALALSACGDGHSASTAQKAAQEQHAGQAEKVKQKVHIDDTVVGMHYVQMAGSVDPLTSQLAAELSAGGDLLPPKVKTVVTELEQFDAAILTLSVPSDLRTTLSTLRISDKDLVTDLMAIEEAQTVTPQQKAKVLLALQRQRGAAAAMSSALGLSTATH